MAGRPVRPSPKAWTTSRPATSGIGAAGRRRPDVPALEGRGLVKHFGGVKAVDGVDIRVDAGSVYGIIGPNGSGKSTTVACLTRFHPVDAGEVLVCGEPAAARPHAVAGQGVTRVFQTPHLFERQSVLDNVLAGMRGREDYGLVSAVLRSPGYRRREAASRAEAAALLAFAGLSGRSEQQAGTLSHGQKRLLEVVRAVASGPRVLVLDELTTGLVPAEIDALARLCRAFRAHGLAVVLIEHNMNFVMDVCDRITVIDSGKVIACGAPAEVRAEPARCSTPTWAVPTWLRRSRDRTAGDGRNQRGLRRRQGARRGRGDGRAGRVRRPARPERRRQEHDPEGAVGPAEAVRLDGVVRRGGHHRGSGWRRSGLGIGHVPEGRRIFPDHTVLENLRLGGFPPRRSRARTQRLMDEVLDLFPRLAERRDQAYGTLSGGEAQMLAVARALMSEPRLLVLDEPSLGLAPLKAAELFSYIKRLHTERGISVLLVEQLALIALRLADRAYVLERGRVGLRGRPRTCRPTPWSRPSTWETSPPSATRGRGSSSR